MTCFSSKLFNEVSPGNSLLPGNMLGSLDEPGYKAITDDIKQDYKLLFGLQEGHGRYHHKNYRIIKR